MIGEPRAPLALGRETAVTGSSSAAKDSVRLEEHLAPLWERSAA